MLKLVEPHELDEEAQKLKAIKKLQKDWTDINRVLHYQGLLFFLEIIQTELISRQHNKPLAEYFGINKTRELIGRKYYWPSLRKDVQAYVKSCNVCLTLKAVKYKPYNDLQTLPIPIY